jgi:hypothetical protein
MNVRSSPVARRPRSCGHTPPCPTAGDAAGDTAAALAAAALVRRADQGWSLLCNGVVVFDDGGAILPDGVAIDPRR